MKRSLTRVIVCLAMVTVPSQLFAFSYTETVINIGPNAPGYNYVSNIQFTDGYIGWLQTETWGHSLSSDFMTVPDNYTVNNATLEISGYRALGVGLDLVQFGGTYSWTDYDGWAFVAATDNVFDLTYMEASYWNTSPLNVSLTPVFDMGVYLTSSILSVNYDPASSAPPITAVPEPTTILLFGAGLIGAGMAKRRRRLTNNQA